MIILFKNLHYIHHFKQFKSNPTLTRRNHQWATPCQKKRYWSFGKCIPKFKIMLLSISFLLLLIQITTGLECDPGEGLDGFGGPYEKEVAPVTIGYLALGRINRICR